MTQLGRYEVVKPLARGSMADLLLARTTGMQAFERHVVIKQIRQELATDDKLVKMFLDEARLSASLHHQNIVQVYDVGEHDGAYFFAMEYVHGEDLRTIIQKVQAHGDAIPLEVVCLVVIAAAAGLHHAHEKVGPDRKPLGIIHRDVSPSNVLIGYDGSVKLVDFGLAKAGMRSVTTRTGTLKGKAGYMSPEQCRGLMIDRRSDVFGLGILLYELLTTRRLFKAQNEYLTMTAIVQSEVPPPSTLRRDLPKPLDDIALRALAKNPDQRFQTAEQLRDALERFMVEAELRTSPRQLSEYMKQLFGERVEPWLSPHTGLTALERDTPNSGLVDPPATLDPTLIPRNPRSIAPIAVAQALATGESTLIEPPVFTGEEETLASPPPEFPRDEDDASLDASTLSFVRRDPAPPTRPPPVRANPIHDAPTELAPPRVTISPPRPAPAPAVPAPPPPRPQAATTVKGRSLRVLELASQPTGIAIACIVVVVVTAMAFARC